MDVSKLLKSCATPEADVQDMHRVGSALVTAATAPLAFGLAGDVYVVITKIAESPAVGLAAGSLALISLIGLWYAYPLLAASIRTGPIPLKKSANARLRTVKAGSHPPRSDTPSSPVKARLRRHPSLRDLPGRP